MSSTEKIACHTILFGGIGGEEDYSKLEMIRGIGFPGVEGVRLDENADWIPLRERMDKCGIRLATLDFPGLIMGLNDKQLRETAEKQVEIGRLFGCDTIVTMLPRTDGKNIHYFGTCTEHYEEAAKKMNLIGEIFHDNGMKLCIHNHIDHMTESVEEMSILMQETNDNFIGICFDTAHAVCAGHDPLRYAEKFKSRIWHLHVKDTENLLFGRPYFFKNSFVPLGEGVIDLTTILKLFKDDDFQGWYTFEFDGGFSKGAQEHEARISLDFLKNNFYEPVTKV